MKIFTALVIMISLLGIAFGATIPTDDQALQVKQSSCKWCAYQYKYCKDVKLPHPHWVPQMVHRGGPGIVSPGIKPELRYSLSVVVPA
ncbi:hypothetical protein NX059_002558 [Plenodomus lindquistii]|nr:hypothetical protein NX059_002558 [Plenodomus lindquistii]